jgi:hypothetical protein
MAEGSDDHDGHSVGSPEHMSENKIELTPTAQFVQRLAHLTASGSSYSVARATLIIGRYVDWAQNSRQLPLVESLMLDPQVIDLYVRDFIGQGLLGKKLSKSSVATYRSLLKRASEIANPRDDANQIAQVPSTNALAPYSPEQVDMFLPWMRGQATELRRRKATALGCLGLGCGLAAGSINSLRRLDVIDDGHITVVVTNGDKMREVPMVSRWEQEFRRLIADLNPDDYVFGAPQRPVYQRQISQFLYDADGQLRPSTFRMRSTWLVGRLNAGVPLAAVLKAAGLLRLEQIDDLLPFLRQPDDASFALLRKEVQL